MESNKDKDLGSYLNVLKDCREINRQTISIQESDDMITTEEAKRNVKTIVQAGMEAIDDLIQIAKMSEDSRVYQALSNLIKAVGELNVKIIEKTSVRTSTVNNNSLFVGSTKELLDAIEALRGDEED